MHCATESLLSGWLPRDKEGAKDGEKPVSQHQHIQFAIPCFLTQPCLKSCHRMRPWLKWQTTADHVKSRAQSSDKQFVKSLRKEESREGRQSIEAACWSFRVELEDADKQDGNRKS